MGDVRIPDINQVMIAGRITREPELRYLQSGAAICSFGIAHDRHYKDKAGEKKKETTFVEIEAWAKTGELVAEYMDKGDPVVVEGRLKFDQWDDKQTGQKRTKLTINASRVQPLAWKGSSKAQETPQEPRTRPDVGEPEVQDDIPF